MRVCVWMSVCKCLRGDVVACEHKVCVCRSNECSAVKTSEQTVTEQGNACVRVGWKSDRVQERIYQKMRHKKTGIEEKNTHVCVCVCVCADEERKMKVADCEEQEQDGPPPPWSGR